MRAHLSTGFYSVAPFSGACIVGCWVTVTVAGTFKFTSVVVIIVTVTTLHTLIVKAGSLSYIAGIALGFTQQARPGAVPCPHLG